MQRLILMATVLSAAWFAQLGSAAAADRPNILWLTFDDASCNMGCYGDEYADTPTLDRLAAEGVRYTQAFSTASVCTPCRSCLITGMRAVTLGSQHLRSPIRLPEQVACFPALLREAGYYCTNNVKEDYNFPKPPGVWDESSTEAHWRNRSGEQPFFAVFNTMITHQSRVRMPEAEFAAETNPYEPFARHNPGTVPLPPYYPDTPGFRKEMARYYDQISAADGWVASHLRQLEEAGLADDTIVFVYSDHGAGLPRHKRALYDSGVHVPLIVHFPEKYADLAPVEPGLAEDRLVSFVDFAPTVLSLAGVSIPENMQGRAFLGEQAPAVREYVYFTRDRVDEVYEMIRGVRDDRFKYIRNFMPHRPYMEVSEFCEPALMVRDLRRLAEENRIEGAPALYMRHTKPTEELYDLHADPNELNNLADDPRYASQLRRMRAELRRFMLAAKDKGLLLEGDMFRRAGDHTIWEMGKDESRFPVEAILDTAEMVGRPQVSVGQLVERTEHSDPAVRYWAVIGMMAPGFDASPAAERLNELLDDPSPEVRITAAEALCRLQQPEQAVAVLAEELQSDDPYVRLHAAATLAVIGPHAAGAKEAMQNVLERAGQGDMWMFTQWALARCYRQLNWPIPESVPTLY